ncbi:hypothetical protein Dimus_008401 [Dionaea muscipula]
MKGLLVARKLQSRSPSCLPPKILTNSTSNCTYYANWINQVLLLWLRHMQSPQTTCSFSNSMSLATFPRSYTWRSGAPVLVKLLVSLSS